MIDDENNEYAYEHHGPPLDLIGKVHVDGEGNVAGIDLHDQEGEIGQN